MLIGGVLLFIDLFLPWQDFGNEFSDAVGRKGWYGAAGVILGILTIILLAWLIVRLASVDIPLPVSTAMSAAVIGVLILIFAVIKLLSILGDETTIWAWVGLVLAIVVAAGAFKTVQEAGGVDTLRTEAGGLSTSMNTGGAAAAPAAAAPAAAAPAAEPEAPPAAEPEAPPAQVPPEAPAPEASAPEPDTPDGEPSNEQGA